jgi:hypothetical protein
MIKTAMRMVSLMIELIVIAEKLIYLTGLEGKNDFIMFWNEFENVKNLKY